MAEKDLPSSSNATADITKLEGVIVILTLLIKIGKYLPWIVLAFAVGNLTLAVFCFTWWNSMAWGILNLVFAVAGFVFFAQLVRRRKIHRENYRYARKDNAQRETADKTEEGKLRAAEAG
jgi:membrane protein implicated in regulation of membrane protease activity